MEIINWLAVSGILVDLVIISMIVSHAYLGYRRGIISMLFKILVFIASLIIVFFLYKPFSNLIIEKTQLDDMLAVAIQKNLEGTTLSDGKLLEPTETNLSSSIVTMINDIASKAIKTAETNVIGAVSVQLSHMMIRIGSIIVLLIVSRFLLFFVKFFAELIGNLPIIKLFNKTGGMVFGIIKAFLIAYFILAIFSVIAPLISSWGVITAINSSKLGSIMYNNNFILNLIMK